MSANWPLVPLASVLRHRKEFITIDDTTTYKRPRVRLHAQGTVTRDELPGALIKTKTQQVCRAGEFLVAEIDAKVGGFGIVPQALDGAIVSSHYFLYAINESKLDRRFFGWFVRTPTFRDQVEAQGSTNYAAIRPHDVLKYTLPLPSLDEQRRIVARIEELASKLRLAQSLRRQSSQESDTLATHHARSVFDVLANDVGEKMLADFAPQVTSGPRDWAKCYAQTGFRFYRAQDIGPDGAVVDESKVFIAPPDGAQGRSAALHAGDLMIVITGATVGRCAVFANHLEPGFVSQHVAICRLPSDAIEPRFVWWGLRAPHGQRQLLGQRYGQGKPGLNPDEHQGNPVTVPSFTRTAKSRGRIGRCGTTNQPP